MTLIGDTEIVKQPLPERDRIRVPDRETELVPAEPSDERLLADGRPRAGDQRHERRVAGRMTV